jgi:ABC-type nitrate/sulfonate/bicarbonate transport system permease component
MRPSSLIAAGRGSCRTGLWRKAVFQELRAFIRSSFGSLLGRESLRLLIPLLVLWEALPYLGVAPRSLMPPPSALVTTVSYMFSRLNLVYHLEESALRFILGFILAVITAIPIGVLLGWNSIIGKHCLPLFQILAPIPPSACVPVTVIILGIGLPMQVFLIFLGVFYPVLFNAYQGVKETDPRYIASARVFGASEFTIITRVLFWHALGSIVMGVRIGSSIGLIMLVVAEMHASESGIGYLLMRGKEYFQIDRMVVCMLLLGFAGWFINEQLKYLETKLAVWRIER